MNLDNDDLGLRNLLYMIIHTKCLSGDTIRSIVNDVMKEVEKKEEKRGDGK